MKILNQPFLDLQTVAKQHYTTYFNNTPFPNIHFNQFFNPIFLEKVLTEFPDLSKTKHLKYNNTKEKKFASKGVHLFGQTTQTLINFLNAQPFLQFLQTLTGIQETLIPDPYFAGGGLHEIKKGGLLKIHADFNKHPLTKLDRRINVLIYLNKDWQTDYGGDFELWDKNMTSCVKKIQPTFNTMAIFSTTDFSYHGHPDPLNCPTDRSRKSIALYYYSNGRPQDEINHGLENHSTLFIERKNNKTDQTAFQANSSLKQLLKECIPPIVFRMIKNRK